MGGYNGKSLRVFLQGSHWVSNICVQRVSAAFSEALVISVMEVLPACLIARQRGRQYPGDLIENILQNLQNKLLKHAVPA